MPQISKSLREPLRRGEAPIKEKGDLCYLITVELIIPMWAANPRWNTASELRQMLVKNPDLVKLKAICRGSPFADDEILNQAAMAYYEFYRRVVANYEDAKARLNSDVYAGVMYAKSNAMLKGE